MTTKMITKIDGNWINDASAIHDISANERSYTIRLGNSESAYTDTSVIDIPSDVNAILDNLTTHLILKDTSDPDIAVYNKTEMDYVITTQNTSINKYSHEIGLINEYDPYTIYYKNQLTMHNGDYYRCIVSQTTGGTWVSSHWTVTNIVNEILDIRGVQVLKQKVIVHGSFDRTSDVSISDQTVTIFYNSSQGQKSDTANFNSDGNVMFFMNFGYQYTVTVSDVSGYRTPTADIYVANGQERVINLQYKQVGSGVFIVDNNGVETDYELWDPANNANARFVKLTNSSLCTGSSSEDNSIVISKNWELQKTSLKWQIEYKDLPSLTNYSSSTGAETDLRGFNNSSLAYYDCDIRKDQYGRTLVEAYNTAQGTSITVNDYLPAIMHCLNTTESFLGGTVHAYLPSMGQLRQLYINIADVNAALLKIGKNPVIIGSGYWWSSTEFSSYCAWFLSNGTTYTSKTLSDSVLPIFAL